MVLMEFDNAGSGCKEEDWGLSSSGFLENCSNQLEYQGEESMFGLSELVCVTAVCILLMLLGILGNMLTILVVWLRPHMRSSTYLYLSSMAVSDLLILLLLPLDLYKLWRPRPWPLSDMACKLTMFLSECCTFSTILHITFLSLERYMAVCWPIVAKTLVTRHRTKALIGCLWLGAVLSATPVLLLVGVEDVGQELGWVEEEVQWWERRADDGWTGSGSMEDEGRLTQGFVSAAWEGGVDWWPVGEAVEGGGEEMRGWDGGGKQKEREKVGDTGLSGMARGGGEADKGGEGERKKSEPGGAVTDAETNEQTMRREGRDGREVTQGDNIECRCTDYAVSSGLMSAMMILSNLYFLVSLGILAMVYSLIGRTLLLRPQSSRRDQSHRHTVKMLATTTNYNMQTQIDPYVVYYLTQYFNLVSFVLFYLSAAINPLLYNLMSARYRQAMRSIMHSLVYARAGSGSAPHSTTTTM
ncbi:Growth hormone secretagogue receptor type 1 [Merluccius polli]|uniref:Growth hormone secretagogue receptor type 1 n=1 Tax=Merluccius polli TaxID=89951 RepID=A0AA47M0W3_MERPO|nr:Growth hormone secretagogue receptor type 1 [Merluccius polli]